MKRDCIIVGFIILFLFMIYNYHNNKVTEVYLSGKVVGFNTEGMMEQTSESNSRIINTSYKSIGTITFIKNTGDYGALGHSVQGCNLGECYEIKFENIEKSKANNVGSIIADLDEDSKIGCVLKNSEYGIFGSVDNINAQKQIKIQTASRYEIEKGTAYIYIDFDGKGLKKYEIEINGINYFAFTKNIKITITSEELIKKCGGIVQGMSGAPIVQNGKLVGAINSVDIENPVQANGIFIDKMI